MTPPASPATRPLALLAAGLVLATAACGTSSDQGGASPAPTVTVTETASAPPSSPTGVPATSSPRASSATLSPGPGTGGGSGGSGTCTYDDLSVRYADDPGGAGAGNVNGTFTFTNRSSEPCSLRGFPGVSYVARAGGGQVGQAATRTDDEVVTKTLKAGGSVKASLRRSQPRNYGDACDETDVKGFKVYAPGETGAFFVTFETTGCKSADAPLLQVGPVR